MFDGAISPKAFAARLAVFYGALFVVYGTHVPYMPVWLDWRGLTAGEISAVLAAPFFLRLLVTPAAAIAADRSGGHRAFVIALSWASLAICIALSQALSFWPILALGVLLIVCNSTIMPLTETLAVAGVRSAGLDYGRMRLWGSLTFVAASFAGGLAVASYGGGAGVWLVAFGCLLTVIAAHALPRPAVVSATAAPSAPLWRAEEPAQLLRAPAFRAFLIAAGGAMAAHATFLGFGTLIWSQQGLSGGWIGSLWAIGVFVEVCLFSVSGWLVRTVGPARLLIAACAISVVRWTAMALQPGFAMLIVLQAMHGVTYGATHIAAIHFVSAATPRHAHGVGQALYATVAAGVAMGAATLIAGWLYAPDGAAAYLAMAAIAAISLAAAVRLAQVWRGETLIAERGRDDAAGEPEALAPEPGISG